MNETIYLAGGCFWCTEAIFNEIDGVVNVVSGYSGGTMTDPTYEDVCTDKTGHAETIRVIFDDSKITLRDILEIFFETHDPTTLNRQGEDVGTQYRSAVFYTNDDQRKLVTSVIKELTDKHRFSKPIVTQVEKFTSFYPSEDYHHNYFARNGNAPYCRSVISPKVQKFRKNFKDRIRVNL
ncbi:MAG: peptide-methionine (S)-S-oxide reductase MsrA [Thermoplasmataceae archaeon]